MGAKLGVYETGAPVEIDLYAALHTLLVGQTRSGKSVLSYALLAQAAADDRVLIAGCDPSGILLAPVLTPDTEEWVSLGTGDALKALSVMQNLVAEMDRRINWLMRQGRDKVNPGVDFPLVLVVLEEFAGQLAALDAFDATCAKPADRVKPKFMLAFGRLLRESAKVGYRLCCILQRADASIVGGDTRDQFSRRIVHRSTQDGIRMLLELATPEQTQRLLSAPPGVALYWEAGRDLLFGRSKLIEYPTFREFVIRRMTSKTARFPEFEEVIFEDAEGKTTTARRMKGTTNA